MHTIRLLIIGLFCCFQGLLQSAESQQYRALQEGISTLSRSQIEQLIQGPGPLHHFLQKKAQANRKLTAAVLAFPFPFGIVGLHRIYLGCAPYVPVVYIASLGGIFGLIPLIDFIVILTEKDLDRFTNSGKVFMWVE
jgi:TM2 domain-containing membrane protein YozV